jgi:hypothetical protein
MALSFWAASLQSASLQATDLSDAYLWRTNTPFAPNTAVSLSSVKLPDSPQTWSPVANSDPNSLAVYPWTDKSYQSLRRLIESLPFGDLRNQALGRIRRLDCASGDTSLVSCDSLAPATIEAASWREQLQNAGVDDAAFDKALATTLKPLVCSADKDSIYILRGLSGGTQVSVWLEPSHLISFVSNRIRASQEESAALIDFLMGANCPVSAYLTADDVAGLREPPKMIFPRHRSR